MKILFMKVMNISRGDFTWIEIDECDIDDMKGIGNRIKKNTWCSDYMIRRKLTKLNFEDTNKLKEKT